MGGKAKLNLINQKFGRLTVVEELPRRIKPSGQTMAMWRCVCDCGAICDIIGSNLTKGLTKSCGCLAVELRTKHGLTGTNIEELWRGILQRCYNTNSNNYHNYGGRGVKVCDRWMCKEKGLVNFVEDMLPTYKKGLEIDRIDVDGDYEPLNCRWVTKQQNSFNRRPKKNCSSKYKGVSFDKRLKNFTAAINPNYGKKHIGIFSDEIEAALNYDKAAEIEYGEYAWLNRDHFLEVMERYETTLHNKEEYDKENGGY